ncbi:MAG: ATP synthase subunit B [Candidatus Tokpelaia sp. JSC189]|nr:MAG: ATP synthase subunit B [Candidatus Tokpelaia sp. JSC189]
MTDTFWELIALVLFFILLGILKIPSWVVRTLDHRAQRIYNELEEARCLREEAQQLLAEYQRKRFEAEKEAKAIIEVAEREANILMVETHKKILEYIEHHDRVAEQKIAQAEIEAVNTVRSTAINLAIVVAEKILSEGINKEETNNHLFQASLNEIRASLN